MLLPAPFRQTVLAALTLLVVACGPDPIPNTPIGDVPPPPSRSGDGLLDSPELQAVVDLQVARDGAGLVSFLDDPDPRVRGRAAYALASVQDPEAGSSLAGLLSDSEPSVRADAAFALGQLLDPDFGPILVGAFRREDDPNVRVRLLEAIGKAGDMRVVEPLLGLELSEDEEASRNLAL